MKNAIKDLIVKAIGDAHAAGLLPCANIPDIEVEEPRSTSRGDLSTNTALVMARIQKMAPRKIAEVVVTHIQDPENIIEKTEIAGAGFINFLSGPRPGTRSFGI